MNLNELNKLTEKYTLLKEKKEKPVKEKSIFFSEERYDWQDWAEIGLCKETLKINPEGEKVRQKIIERLKKCK